MYHKTEYCGPFSCCLSRGRRHGGASQLAAASCANGTYQPPCARSILLHEHACDHPAEEIACYRSRRMCAAVGCPEHCAPPSLNCKPWHDRPGPSRRHDRQLVREGRRAASAAGTCCCMIVAKTNTFPGNRVESPNEAASALLATKLVVVACCHRRVLVPQHTTESASVATAATARLGSVCY